MRKLSENFLTCLKSGFLSPITQYVKNDPDLDLEIRDASINVYYKGNSLLKLAEKKSAIFRSEIHKKFLAGIDFPLDFTEKTVPQFITNIPILKQNITRFGKHSLETEYEQMIIRANNFELRNNTEYLTVDRQYAINGERYDLTGIFWDRKNRQNNNQEIPICLMEVKFALNNDIKDVHHQLLRYYSSIKPNSAKIAEEMQTIFQQKLELGLYQQPLNRLDALKSLTFSKNIETFQFILILVDYNPNSTLLELQQLSDLPFANQIRIFFSGFAMWQQNVKPLEIHLP